MYQRIRSKGLSVVSVTAVGLAYLIAYVNAHGTSLPLQEQTDRCEMVKASIVDAGFSNKVTVTCENGHAHVSADTYPDHPLMIGIVNSNEQVPIPAADYSVPIPLVATPGSTPKTRDSSLAIAVNGVPIYDYTGGGEMSVNDLYHHQTQHDTLLTQQLDICGGHAGRGDDYHYHVAPTCMIDAMKNSGDDAILGWAFDGFPLYGNKNPDGTPIGEETLDVCNGQEDETFGYRYHTSIDAPYMIQCLMGDTTDLNDMPRVSPLKPAGNSDRLAPGRPPAGGVDNLTFTQTDSGKRSMDYSYRGESYYIRYTPSDTPDCYTVEARTVTNQGALITGEYCR